MHYSLKTNLTTAALVYLLASIGQAFIGDDEQKLTHDYGSPNLKIETDLPNAGLADILFFKTKKFRITVTILKGLSAKEEITRENKEPLTEQEVDTLLASNGHSHVWRLLKSATLNMRIWRRDDDAIAIAIPRCFIITSTILAGSAPKEPNVPDKGGVL